MVKTARTIINQEAGFILAAATLIGSLLTLFSLALFAFVLFEADFFAFAGALTLADLGAAGFDVILVVELAANNVGKVTIFCVPLVGSKLQDQTPLSSTQDCPGLAFV